MHIRFFLSTAYQTIQDELFSLLRPNEARYQLQAAVGPVDVAEAVFRQVKVLMN